MTTACHCLLPIQINDDDEEVEDAVWSIKHLKGPWREGLVTYTFENAQWRKVKQIKWRKVKQIQPLFRSEVRMALRYFLSLESRRVNVTQDKPAVFLVTSWSVCVAILLPYFGLQCGFSQFNSELQSQLMLDTEQVGQCGFPVALQWPLKLVSN